MRKAVLPFPTTLLSLILALASPAAFGWEPDTSDEMELAVKQAILAATQADPGLQAWFDHAAGYAVFPKVGKGGLVVGGAYGTGIVIGNNVTVGRTTLSQGTIGLQLGGQVFSEFVFFEDTTALEDFKRGNFELSAQASAVALVAGASANTSYSKGVAVFTHATGGLMVEASVGGQQFTYEPL